MASFMQRRLFTTSRVTSNYYKITLRRSTIGLSEDYRAAARTLGLHRLQATTYHQVNPSIAGLILKLKEVVQVENVSSIPTKAETQAAKPDRGYKVVGRM